MWFGADGFGNTREEEQKRDRMIVKLCRDYQFGLLKCDSPAATSVRRNRCLHSPDARACRKYRPDLISTQSPHRSRQGGALGDDVPLRGRRNLYRRPHGQRHGTCQDGHAQPGRRLVAKARARTAAAHRRLRRVPVVVPRLLGGRPGVAGLQPLPDLGPRNLRQSLAACTTTSSPSWPGSSICTVAIARSWCNGLMLPERGVRPLWRFRGDGRTRLLTLAESDMEPREIQGTARRDNRPGRRRHRSNCGSFTPRSGSWANIPSGRSWKWRCCLSAPA